MGTVWLAERSDGEFHQKVAIKFLAAGLRRPGWRERFLRERQLLASLNHPAIVHATDAGRTEHGQPYLVMEYVDGTPIDAYVAGRPIEDRLRLFIKVCEGVAHAHRHLIIHRDLKPSNILVDGNGQPKLLDFGIAKLLDETGEQTETIERMLTPKYASPEQFQGAPQTTVTDVYSLGAVLHTLTTGHSPHDSSEQTASRLNPSVPSDLDYILRKALRTEPEERYASVDAFADDIGALVDGRPVAARSGDTWYRARKTLRRHRVPLTAAAIVIASLSAGLYVANRERVIAQRRFQQVRQLANQFFALDAAIRTLPGSTDARRQIVSTSIGYLEALGREAQNDRDLALEIGAAYLQVARVQGVPSGSNLGDFEAADRTLAKAEQIVDGILTADPNNRRALRTSAEISHDRMILANGDSAERQVGEARKTESRLAAFLALGTASTDEITNASNLLTNVALAYHNLHRLDDAVRAARQAVQLGQPLEAKEAQRARGRALTRLAELLRWTRELEQALRTIREARPVVESAEYTSEQQRTLALEHVVTTEGLILGDRDGISLGRTEEGIPLLQQALDMTDHLATLDSHDAQSRYREASDALSLGAMLSPRDADRALAVYDQAIRRLREMPPTGNRWGNESHILAESARVMCDIGRLAQAKQTIDEVFALLQQLENLGPNGTRGFWSAIALHAKAVCEERMGQPAAAATTFERALAAAAAERQNGDLSESTRLSEIYRDAARFHMRAGNRDRATAIEAARPNR
jgi:tetratricopeptide (TPR) repeat protein